MDDNQEVKCVRCGLNPAVRDFICVDCLYKDYEHAVEAWGQWQQLAEKMAELFGTTGAEDYTRYSKLLDRMDKLNRGEPAD